MTVVDVGVNLDEHGRKIISSVEGFIRNATDHTL